MSWSFPTLRQLAADIALGSGAAHSKYSDESYRLQKRYSETAYRKDVGGKGWPVASDG